MNKKTLMSFLILSFFLAVSFLIFVFFKNKKSATSSLPYLVSKVTPTLVQSAPTLVQDDPFLQKGEELISAFKSINDDVEKVLKDDLRLLPPQFYFEKEVTE
jgi:hypothetical protein